MGIANEFMLDVNKELDKAVVHPMNKVIRKVVKDGYTEVTDASPVWTGFFRSNWRLTLTGESTYSSSWGFKELPKSHVPGNDLFALEYSRSKGVANNAVNTFSVRSHSSIYLTNNTPYAGILEYGGGRGANAEPRYILGRAVAHMKTALDAGLKAIP